ncbi:MAG: 2-nitropropane dioxygenase, partial [Burkholderiaceae bacterium]|nr:2-nitropropane dioxygenase [Burkholderiaceae bacterium]
DCVEASAFMMMTPALVYYRVKGLIQDSEGNVQCKNRIIAKISRPEVAKSFLSPPPKRIVAGLLSEGKISQEQAELAEKIAMSFDLCVESDSAGHTDQGISTVLFPSILSLKEEIQEEYQYNQTIHIGLAGGIGTPHAAVAATALG